MSKRSIAAEFARRARGFYPEVENPMNIQCWGYLIGIKYQSL